VAYPRAFEQNQRIMKTKNRRPGRPTQAEAERLDEQLRHAAVETFLQFGYDAASMEAIARAAGITKQTLYSRYPDKRAVFADVIPWAMSRYERTEVSNETSGDDLVASLTAIARDSLARATDPQILRLQRIAMNESARFPEFAISAETMRWSPRLRAVMDVLRQHKKSGNVDIESNEIELAAEHFLALVEALPHRLAEFGVFRTGDQAERHLQYAIKLFLRAIQPVAQKSGARRNRAPTQSRHRATGVSKHSTSDSATKGRSRTNA
jgi:TetR/AcrR family transcriptional regulator, mexJK operon transcriptional repressor